MQIRVSITVNNEEGLPPLPKGTVIPEVVEVHLCRYSPHLLSVEVGKEGGDRDRAKNQFFLLPRHAVEIEESPGWQTYARRTEAAIQASKIQQAA